VKQWTIEADTRVLKAILIQASLTLHQLNNVVANFGTRRLLAMNTPLKISPIKSAVKMGKMTTSHTDAPAALPNLIMVMWACESPGMWSHLKLWAVCNTQEHISARPYLSCSATPDALP
jgi:hypothetical protein